MMADHNIRPDGTVAFLPHRLNRYPVIVRGLTADELWACAGLSAAIGFLVGLPLALVFSTFAVVPTSIVIAIAMGVFAGGSALRRLKRGRPEVWLYRQMQWRLTNRFPSLARFMGSDTLIIRSGYWTTHRSLP